MELEMRLHGYSKWNLGCGESVAAGYMNVGFWRHLEPDKLYTNPWNVADTVLLNYDLTQGIPAEDGSLDVCFHSHFLEHLSFYDGIAFLRECYRVTARGGIHRIVVPDLEVWINSYQTNSSLIFEKFKEECIKKEEYKYFQTRTSIFVEALYARGHHKCFWDFETLKSILETIGFVDVTRKLYQESKISKHEILQIERYGPLRSLESLCIECSK